MANLNQITYVAAVVLLFTSAVLCDDDSSVQGRIFKELLID